MGMNMGIRIYPLSGENEDESKMGMRLWYPFLVLEGHEKTSWKSLLECTFLKVIIKFYNIRNFGSRNS